jgi:putative tryptophan/tyrosine transport system substrate-binding protein
MQNMLAHIEEAARATATEIHVVGASDPNEFDVAFEAMVAARSDALIVLPSPMFYTNYRHLVDLAARHRLPTVYVWREAVEVGGLMSYGADIPDLTRRAGKYAAKILKGAKPSDLPVEQPHQCRPKARQSPGQAARQASDRCRHRKTRVVSPFQAQ